MTKIQNIRNKNLFMPARPVFDSFAKTPGEVPGNRNSITEKLSAQERENNVNTPKVPFSGNPDSDIPEIAKKAFPENPEKQEYYTRKIEASLKAYLKDGKEIKDLWQFLDSQNCTFEQMVMGVLRFFKGEKGEFEININDFLIPPVLKAESNGHQILTQERQEQIKTTTTELSGLLAELRAQHPDLPPLPTKIA